MRNIETPVSPHPLKNWTHVYMNVYTRNNSYYHLLKYLLFLLKHPVYIYIKMKVNYIGHILRRNCLMKHFIEGNVQGRIEVAVRRGRRRKHLLNDHKEGRGYLQLQAEAPGRTVPRALFGKV